MAGMWNLKLIKVLCFCVGITWIPFARTAPEKYTIDVDYGNDTGYVEHFWESTGLCPPEPYGNASEYLLSPDIKLNLALMGSLPRHNLLQVRIHWLLNLIKFSFKNKEPHYDFTQVDNLMVTIHKNGLKPGFELMGNPSKLFTDFENKTQLYWWRDLIKSLAKHYIGIFGLNYVQQWNFESWNEPDHKDFDGLNFTLQGFMNYYDACSEGLRLAHPSLKLGGPAESFRGKFTHFAYNLLAHCASGTNYFTGQKGIRLDFISMHKKGNVTSISILEEELATIREIISIFPKFKDTPIYNDEADPLVGWWKPEPWRADNTYAAMITKVISQHLNLMLLKENNSINYKLLSNDNGFLNTFPEYFEQRTLVARFVNLNNKTMTSNMVRKPVFTATGLLNYLGENYVKIKISQKNGQSQLSNNSHVGAVAAYHKPTGNPKDSLNFGLIIYNSNDTYSSNISINLTINILLPNLTALNRQRKFGSKINNMMWTCYKMDNNLTNPYRTWRALGQPAQPNADQLQKIRLQEGPYRVGLPQSQRSLNGQYTFHYILHQPGILVLHGCVMPSSAPGKIINIQFHSSLNADCIITWHTPKIITKCIKTYELQYSLNVTGPYTKLNHKDVIFPSFPLDPNSAKIGFYRIRAVDYWSRRGPWSTTYGQCSSSL